MNRGLSSLFKVLFFLVVDYDGGLRIESDSVEGGFVNLEEANAIEGGFGPKLVAFVRCHCHIMSWATPDDLLLSTSLATYLDSIISLSLSLPYFSC